MSRSTIAWLIILLSGCGPPPPPLAPVPEPQPAPTPALEPYSSAVVWSRTADVPLRLEEGSIHLIPFLFTRLDVAGRDADGLVVRCAVCPNSLEGRVSESDVISTHLPPEISAWGDLAEFLLSVRDAAERRDLQALRPVMAPDFTFSLVGMQRPEIAFDVWLAENFTSLDQLVDLLDQGVTTRDGRIWSAPPAFVLDFRYQGLRAGFSRRADGRWEWLYLIRGINDRPDPRR